MVTTPVLPLITIAATIFFYISPSSTPPNSARGTELSREAPRPSVSAEPDAAKADSQAAPPASTQSARAILTRGALAGVVGWLLVGAVAASLNTVDRANRGVYRELGTRLASLEMEHKSAVHARETRATKPMPARSQRAPTSEEAEPKPRVTQAPATDVEAESAPRTTQAGPDVYDEIARHIVDLSRELKSP